MKSTTKYILASIALLALIIACTKEVGLYTEVEFEITEEHEADGFISTPLATFLTITPEELLEDLSYSFSYKINSGAGYFEAVDGTTIEEGVKASFNPLSASLDYIPTAIGNHSVTFTASDTFGFTKEITLTYTITNIPVTWTAEGPTGPVLLGSSQSITVTLGNEAAVTGATYQRNYSFSEGSGNLYTAAPESNTIAVNDFVSIEPGTYELEYISNELGVTTIEFLLRDSNEQELITTVTFEVVDELSSEKEITSFIVNGVAGTITGTTIDVLLPEGTDLTALAPVIIHTGASISPESETNQDFSSPVIYTVTAQDETIQAYTVNCSSNVSVASVAITPNPITINIGGTENLSAVILPANATNQNVTWSSSDDAIASVSAAGVVTGNTTGTATITVTTEDGAFTATSTITVQAATFAVTGITVDPTVITITNGSTTTLTETIAPANATNQNVTWSSSDDAIASVSVAGVVTGNAIGSATITVTTEDGDFTATSTITVQAATFAVTGITVDPTVITITNGSTTTLTETIAPANATNQNVTWSSSDDAIASVSAAGVVTGNAIGTATITVTTEDGAFTATSTITVQAATVAVTGITVDPTSITITNGSTTTLTETIAPANATNQNVTWSSSDDAIASVNAAGVVTGNTTGTATISVTTEDGGFTATSTITVQAATVAVTGITIDPTSITITNGSTTTLTETIAPANATNQNVTWSSSDDAIASVNAAGVVTGNTIGTATISVTTEDGGFTATSTITVQAATFAVTGITVDPTVITITNGSTTTLTETITPANATNQNVTWTSSDDAIASVSATGVVTGNAIGTATITVTTEDGAFTATSTITVQAATVAVTGITVDPTSITITNGSTTTLTETITPANATNQNVTWSSDNTSMATVNAAGVVTGNAIGTATITVTTEDGAFTATSTITVQAATVAVTGITVDPTSITITNGSTTTLTETIAPANATNQNVTWSSSDDAIASVSAAGVVTGNAIGTATITVTTEDGAFTATSTITVQAATFAVTGITVDPTAITITNGSTTTLTETITPANATNQNVTWSSDNTSVATVNASGLVSSVGIGEAKITVTTQDGGFTATSLVTVEAASIAVTSVSISPTSITITDGSTTTLTETIAPANASNQNVTWSSDNTSVATVNASGLVSSVGIGEAKITVTTQDGGFTATSLVTVEAASIAVTGITIDPTSITIINGSTTTLVETITPSNATNQNVTWSSSDDAIATVDATGVVTGVGTGTAIITVTTVDGNFSANNLITVNAVPILVTGVNLTPPTITIIEGATTTLIANLIPNNASNQLVSWSSSNTSVATVNASGVVTGVGVGNTTITVTTNDGNKIATSLITVDAAPIPVTGVNLTPPTLTIINGTTATLAADIEPSNASNQAVFWSSSNTDAATVNASGVVTGVGVGNTIITVTTDDGDKIATSLITVDAAPISVTGVNLTPPTLTIINGTTATLTADIEPSNASNQAVSWSSSNTDAATVNASGVVTGVGVGNTIITVTTDDGNKIATSLITVDAAPIAVTSVAIENRSGSTVAIGRTISLTRIITPSNATNQNVSWVSSNPGKATVSASGVVTGVSDGDVIITVTTLDGNLQDSITLTVLPPTFPSYTFSIDPIPPTVTTTTQALTFRITPNSTALAQNIQFTMSYKDKTGLPNVTFLTYNSTSHIVGSEFTVDPNISTGILEGPFTNCEYMEFEFTVSNNLGLPDQVETINFIVQDGSACN
ncbi:beta strand repeat-containing protein [Cellulophaga baltica]|uniref:beta strand repeat-containing protein n=1 Tax=Cellulophaga baltica TaxID=76594 RepID=UPI00068D3F57|nr:Ig-like domain-containing protein [Cellulophaga baltica]